MSIRDPKRVRATVLKIIGPVLRKTGVLSGLEILDTAIIAARVKAAERKCDNFRDYFHLIQRTGGPFGTRSLTATQKESEMMGLLAIASKLPLKSAVEIGTANGGTLYMLSKAAERDAILLTVDLRNDWKRATLLRSCSKRGQRIHVIRGNSQQQETFEKVIRELGSKKLDLLFVDGDHSLEGVTRDFKLYSKLVRPGGVIAMHDILPDYRTRYGLETESYAGDVPLFWSSIKSSWRSQELVDDYDQDGAGIGLIEWDGSVS
jgi:predicted O-methyltransferase YrrM